MTYSPESGTYFTECRCGGSYVVTEEELEGGAVDTVCCSDCSLAIGIAPQQQLADPVEGWEHLEGEDRNRTRRF